MTLKMVGVGGDYLMRIWDYSRWQHGTSLECEIDFVGMSYFADPISDSKLGRYTRSPTLPQMQNKLPIRSSPSGLCVVPQNTHFNCSKVSVSDVSRAVIKRVLFFAVDREYNDHLTTLLFFLEWL